MFIYSLTNRINGKRYIGQTSRTVEWRWNQHKKHTRSVHFPLYRALRKHGVENFTVETLASACSIDCLNFLEPLFIQAYQSLVPNGYNLDSGGKNNVMHADTKARLSIANKGKKRSPELRAKLSAAKKGHKRSLEMRAKLSGTKRGRELTVDEYRQIYNERHTLKGRKRSHCKRGHLMPDEPNVFDHGKAYRRCRVCVLEYQRNYDRTVRKQPHGRVPV